MISQTPTTVNCESQKVCHIYPRLLTIMKLVAHTCLIGPMARITVSVSLQNNAYG